MKTKILLLVVVTMVSVAFAFGQVAPSAVVGRWQGERHGVPWVTLDLALDNGELKGTAVFFILDRTATEHPQVLGKKEVRLLEPRLVGNVLSFQIPSQQDDVALDPSPGDAHQFHLTLDRRDSGLLKRDGPHGLSVRMTRHTLASLIRKY